MGSDGVVVEPPLFDDLACLAVAGKEMLVQEFVAQTAIERLDQTVCIGLPATGGSASVLVLLEDPGLP